MSFTAVDEGLGERRPSRSRVGWPYIVSGLETLLETGNLLAG